MAVWPARSRSLGFQDNGIVDEGALSVMRRQIGAATGSGSVTVHGVGMGRTRDGLGGGHTGCEATEWESETSARCRVTY